LPPRHSALWWTLYLSSLGLGLLLGVGAIFLATHGKPNAPALLIVVGCVIVIYVPFIVWAYRYRRRDSAGPE
jgi:hypothetical protein